MINDSVKRKPGVMALISAQKIIRLRFLASLMECFRGFSVEVMSLEKF